MPILALAIGVCAHASTIAIVTSDKNAGYADAQRTLVLELERGGLARSEVLEVAAEDLATSAPLATATPKLFVTLGADALVAVLAREPRAPVLAALVPIIAFERIGRERLRRLPMSLSALYLDQPFGRQLDLLKLAVPKVQRVGVLWGVESSQRQSSLATALAARGLESVSGSVGGNGSLFGGLRAAMESADALLAIADPQVFNSATVSNILLATYKVGIPVMAFSPAYVKAGALLSLHTTPAQIGTQVAQMAKASLQSGVLVASQYPQDFSISVNEHVARSLGLNIDEATISERLRRLERQP